MRCELCNTTTRCSCKGGGCPKCNNNNKTVGLTNDLIKFGLSKDTIKEKMSFIKEQLGKIDSYTLYEFLDNKITEEEFNEAVANYNPKNKRKGPETIYGYDEIGTGINPNKQCVYKKPGVRERCVYCNQIKKYMIGKECPRFKDNLDNETQGSTVVKND